VTLKASIVTTPSPAESCALIVKAAISISQTTPLASFLLGVGIDYGKLALALIAIARELN
jgi:hypothetical protein